MHQSPGNIDFQVTFQSSKSCPTSINPRFHSEVQHVPRHLAGPVVESFPDFPDPGIGSLVKVGALREVPTHQAVGRLVQAPFPGVAGCREVEVGRAGINPTPDRLPRKLPLRQVPFQQDLNPASFTVGQVMAVNRHDDNLPPVDNRDCAPSPGPPNPSCQAPMRLAQRCPAP